MPATPSHHTPGPWKHGFDDIRRIDGSGVTICSVVGMPDLPTVQANAKLIALTPRMFEFISDITKLNIDRMSPQSLLIFLKEEARQIIKEIEK